LFFNIAISLGHPLAASGSRILTHLTNELHRTKKKYGLGSACIGGGQGKINKIKYYILFFLIY
jgi:acetyl-CoA acetyltransferase